MGWRSKFGCLVALVGVCACGGVSRFDQTALGNEKAGSDSGGADSAGRDGAELAGRASGGRSAAGASAGGAVGAAGTTGAGGALICAPFKDQAPQTALVVIVNDTTAPIYIGNRMQRCGAQPLYDVYDASNTLVSVPSSCDTPCQSWLAGDPIGGCTAICLPSEVTKLGAGERITIPWSGLYRFQAQLPSVCNFSQLSGKGPVSCSVEKRIEPGSYTFYASAGTGYLCDDNSNGCGECVPGAMGGCVLRGAFVTGAESIAQSLVPLDPGYGISGSAGNAYMTGKPLPIELVFRRPL